LSSKGSFEEVSDKADFNSGNRASSRSSISSSRVSRRDRTFDESIGWLYLYYIKYIIKKKNIYFWYIGGFVSSLLTREVVNTK